jgi:hypothetical protein
MNTETIEVAIDKYVQVRKVQGRQRATESFLAYAYLKCGRDEAKEFMKKVGGLCRYNMNYLRIMENPFRGPEIWWFGLMVLVGAVSCYLMELDESHLVGIVVFSGTLVHAVALLRLTARKWSETGVMIAIYREISEIAENELAGTA